MIYTILLAYFVSLLCFIFRIFLVFYCSLQFCILFSKNEKEMKIENKEIRIKKLSFTTRITNVQ